ncbi:MAG: DNA helicase RecG, partial [Bacilli bacterium]|nr:DNA helicase RecG [Bacilli bacterium]
DPKIKRAIEGALKSDSQIYAVAPQIEDNDKPGFVSAKKLYDGFCKVYPEETTLLHGKMSNEEKEEALNAFIEGRKKILVATSVIEVGIDVPKARLLLVYEASHFSLSSLHQLRGRIGRDGRPAVCLLIESDNSEETLQKLNVLVNTNDGFELSKADLSMRGFGELSGTRQSGLFDLKFASIVDDYKMFLAANSDAKEILSAPAMKGHGYLITLAKTKTVLRG